MSQPEALPLGLPAFTNNRSKPHIDEFAVNFYVYTFHMSPNKSLPALILHVPAPCVKPQMINAVCVHASVHNLP